MFAARERLARWRQYRRMARELGGYSEGELTELGIARADIAEVARTAALGKAPR